MYILLYVIGVNDFVRPEDGLNDFISYQRDVRLWVEVALNWRNLNSIEYPVSQKWWKQLSGFSVGSGEISE